MLFNACLHFFLHLDLKWSTVSGGKTQCTPSYVPKTCLILFFIYQRVILLQLYGVLPNLLRAHYVKTWFSANFWGNIRKTAPIIKTNRVNGPDFLPFKPDDLQSLTDPLRGGSCDFRRRISAWSVAMLIHCFISYTFKTQEMQGQVLKNARFIVLNLTKMTPFRHCRSSGLKGKK